MKTHNPTAGRYRKLPVEIEAAQWRENGDHPQDDAAEMFDYPNGSRPKVIREGAVVRYFRHPEVDGDDLCKHCSLTMIAHGWIDTLEGGHIVCPGDWIITGVKGEMYPCKPDIFAATYESALTEAKGLIMDAVDNPNPEEFGNSTASGTSDREYFEQSQRHAALDFAIRSHACDGSENIVASAAAYLKFLKGE